MFSVIEWYSPSLQSLASLAFPDILLDSNETDRLSVARLGEATGELVCTLGRLGDCLSACLLTCLSACLSACLSSGIGCAGCVDKLMSLVDRRCSHRDAFAALATLWSTLLGLVAAGDWRLGL